jgi:hypothetical protein
MPSENLTPDERTAVARLLRQTIDGDPFPLAPRLRPLKSALAKLDPATVQERPQAPPMPVARPYKSSQLARRKKQREHR